MRIVLSCRELCARVELLSSCEDVFDALPADRLSRGICHRVQDCRLCFCDCVVVHGLEGQPVAEEEGASKRGKVAGQRRTKDDAKYLFRCLDALAG